jgi:hypothetical protein
MTELDQLISAAYENEGKQEFANKVYLSLLRTPLFVPTRPQAQVESEEPFIPLYAEQGDNFFMLVFDTLERLQTWAGEYHKDMEYVEIKGWDVVRGLGEKVYLCLNFGTPFYKEFAPDEVLKLKTIIQRLNPPDETSMH